MNENIETIKQEYSAFIEDISKFTEKGTVVAAGRARKSLLIMGKAIKVLRKQIQERKKELKTTGK
jgi:hypothetical protein